MDSFITCVSTACEAGDIESANKFTTQFSSVCSEFMQPAPILDSLNAVNNTLSFKVVFTAPGFTVLFFQYNVTDSNNQRLVTSNELTSAQSDLASVSVPIQSCNPLNVLMKYGLCDGTVSGGKECNGTVTGHLKSQDLDPTKIKGSGFYGQNCGQPVAAPVTNGNEASGPFNTTAIVGGSIAAVFSVFL
ncbi:hypothetical protein BCR33DRAFT_390053 [Rhizoclosmatium globosum]|uniref:Uncharacterized protein n=1 Tax=Rhizoclosmatium globosum TaxID=329046 RepID=A0A1Y2BXM2_9FUNG|nr:hypothetical protein BCR33DRAFT_390053 [Rhizoclosmatium globosum]|eukprot:ORY39520.1 hypothetical protein BCR33DRAFT_390053 [Rhizoclosmatium globosum]